MQRIDAQKRDEDEQIVALASAELAAWSDRDVGWSDAVRDAVGHLLIHSRFHNVCTGLIEQAIAIEMQMSGRQRPARIGWFHHALGTCSWFRSEEPRGPVVALGHYERAVEFLEEADDAGAVELFNARKNIALCHHTIGRTGDAIDAYRAALVQGERDRADIAPDGTARPDLLDDLRLKLANALLDNNHLEQARSIYEDVGPHFTGPHADASLHLRWHNPMLMLARRELHFDDAREHAEAIAAAAASTGSIELHAAALGTATQFYAELGDGETAISLLGKLEDASSLPRSTLATRRSVLRTRAVVYFLQNRITQALSAATELFDLICAEEGPSSDNRFAALVLFARMAKISGRSSQALDLLEQHLVIDDTLLIDPTVPDAVRAATSYCGLRLVLRQDATENTTQGLQGLGACVMLLGERRLEAPYFSALADHAWSTDQRAGSILCGKLALEALLAATTRLVDPIERSAVLQTVASTASALCERLIVTGRLIEARLIEDVAALAPVIANRPMRKSEQPSNPLPVRDDEHAAIEAWRAMAARAAQLRRDVQATGEARLHRAHRRAQPILWEATRRLLTFDGATGEASDPQTQPHRRTLCPPDTLRLAFSVTAHQVTLHMQTGDGSQIIHTDCDRDALARDVAALRAGAETVAAWRPLARALYDRLLRSVHNLITRANRLEIRVSGILAQLPFVMLDDGRHLLCQRVSVVMTEPVKRRTLQAVNDAGSFAGTLIAAPYAADLPRSQEEGRALAELWPGSRFLAAADCTSSRLKAELAACKDASLFHFAGHFHAVPTSPDLSYLSLSNGAGLTLRELGARFDFSRVRLAMFASCDTSLPQHTSGPHISLVHTVLMAGANQVIGATWPVPDDTTAHFATLFHERLQASCAEPREVLRHVQTAFATSLDKPMTAKPPLEWAGFSIHEGEG